MATGSGSKGALPSYEDKGQGLIGGKKGEVHAVLCLPADTGASAGQRRLCLQRGPFLLVAGPEFAVYVFGHPKEGAESHEGQLGACEGIAAWGATWRARPAASSLLTAPCPSAALHPSAATLCFHTVLYFL